MLTRFDHALVAVRDPDRTMGSLSRLGFEVRRGGWGTVAGHRSPPYRT